MKMWELLGTQYTLAFVIVTANLIVSMFCIIKCLTWYELSLELSLSLVLHVYVLLWYILFPLVEALTLCSNRNSKETRCSPDGDCLKL